MNLYLSTWKIIEYSHNTLKWLITKFFVVFIHMQTCDINLSLTTASKAASYAF